MPHNIFAYGTLMFPEIIQALTGFENKPEIALLKKYSRFAIKKASFPGIIEDNNGEVEGMIYCDVDDRALVLLDWFEADIYVRNQVSVETRNGPVDGFAYVVSEKHRNKLANVPWEPEKFIKKHGRKYTQRCKEYRKIWEEELAR